MPMIRTLYMLKMQLLPMHMGTSSSFLSTLKCWTVRYAITNWGSETDHVTKLGSTTTGVVVSTEASPDASYKTSDKSLEYEIVTQPDLVRHVSDEYQNMALLDDRVLRHRQIRVNKSDTTWNWSFNMPCKSLKGILVLFEEEHSYHQDTSRFYHPKIEKVSVIVKGKPNQLYAQDMRSFEQYDEICKVFDQKKVKRCQCQ